MTNRVCQRFSRISVLSNSTRDFSALRLLTNRLTNSLRYVDALILPDATCGRVTRNDSLREDARMLTAEPVPSMSQRPAGAPWPLSDAARYLGVSHRHLVRLIDSGHVRPIRLGRRVLIADAELHRVASEGVRA